MNRRAPRLAQLLLPALAALPLVLAAGSPAAAGQAGASAAPAAPEFAPGEVVVRFHDQRFGRAVALPSGVGVQEAVGALRANAQVAYAVPNYIATASVLPNDPGTVPPAGGPRAGWTGLQWNFLPCGSVCDPGAQPLAAQSAGGIDAPGAWKHLKKV